MLRHTGNTAISSTQPQGAPRDTLWHEDATALLHDASGGGATRTFRNPIAAVEAWHGDEIAGALAALDAHRARGHHAVGFFAYEMGYALEPHLRHLLPETPDTPLLSFGIFEAPDDTTGTAAPLHLTGEACLGTLKADIDVKTYRARFDEVRALIGAGDVYQINLTFGLDGRFDGAPGALFAALQTRAAARYGAWFALRDRHILSLSPELFIESDGQMIRTRPMKGTAPRAGRAEDDAALAAALATDPKTRAENMMIVDLLRNDLGRIAETGSVRATSLFDIETYPTLHQMTSTVEAHLKPGTSLHDILKAVFPCGSVTGAPKIRAMEIIQALEDRPRGVYCGAVGHLGPGGTLRLNVAIRTLTLTENGQAHLGIGSGLVFDSDAGAEYAECLLKARFVSAEGVPPALFETFRLTRADGYTLLEEHIERISASATYLGYPCDGTKLRAALETAAHDNAHPVARVRLTLSPDGSITTDVQPFAGTGDRPFKLILSARRISSTEPLLYHKTTARDFYDGERARLSDRGADEVIFLNERGELTEGSITNLFLARGDMLFTPALACGLLPGTLRRSLIAQGRACEAVLTARDLETADGLFVGNALRGLIPAELIAVET